jgi:hypothetical protein
VYVDGDGIPQRDLVGRPVEEELALLAQSPERCPEPSQGTRLRGLRPQPTGEPGSRLRAFGERQAGDETLLGSGQVDAPAIDDELEPAEQPKDGCRSRLVVRRWYASRRSRVRGRRATCSDTTSVHRVPLLLLRQGYG